MSASQGEVLDINALEDDLVLQVRVHLAGGSSEALDLLDLSATQEVLDFDGLAVLRNGDIDGEVSVYESHAVSVALNQALIINIKLRERSLT